MDILYLSKCEKYIIVYQESIFMSGYNVYKRIGKSEGWQKVNEIGSFFLNFKEAKKYLNGVLKNAKN